MVESGSWEGKSPLILTFSPEGAKGLRFAGSSCAKASAVVETMAGQAGGKGVL